MLATLMLWPAVTATPDKRQAAGTRHRVIVTALSALAGLSFGSREAEVGGRERVRRVLERA